MVSRREELIIGLLRLRSEGGFSASLEGAKGDGGSVPIQTHAGGCRMRTHAPARCTCWLRSLDEVSRCLRLMRSGGGYSLDTIKGRYVRRLWFNTHERYVAVQRKPMLVQVKHFHPVTDSHISVVSLINKTDLNRKGDGVTRVLVECWSPRADQAWADKGVAWIAAEFVGAPQLPVEMVSELAA